MSALESRQPHEKLLDAISIKCTHEFKVRLAGVAIAEGIDASEFARRAIERAIDDKKSMYEALHIVFGNSKDNEE